MDHLFVSSNVLSSPLQKHVVIMISYCSGIIKCQCNSSQLQHQAAGLVSSDHHITILNMICIPDSARNSPMSDHSSHFDSVLGTAINLGIHSVNEKGSLHYPKVSALAREAKELQGVRSQPGQKKEEGENRV